MSELEIALRLCGQPHLRPDGDYSQGTHDVMYRCVTADCLSEGVPRAVKVTSADSQPVAADNWSITCKSCGALLDPVPGSDASPDDALTVAALASEAAANFYTSKSMQQAEAELNAAQAAGVAADAAAPAEKPSTA